jgi:hypothetical protein
MLENALIARAESSRQIDVGLIAETIFFYQSTHLLLNRSSLVALVKALPPDDLLALIDRSGTKLTYIQPNFAVVSAGLPRTSQFVAVTVGGHRIERELGTSRSTKKINQINQQTCGTTQIYRFSQRRNNPLPCSTRRD